MERGWGRAWCGKEGKVRNCGTRSGTHARTGQRCLYREGGGQDDAACGEGKGKERYRCARCGNEPYLDGGRELPLRLTLSVRAPRDIYIVYGCHVSRNHAPTPAPSGTSAPSFTDEDLAREKRGRVRRFDLASREVLGDGARYARATAARPRPRAPPSGGQTPWEEVTVAAWSGVHGRFLARPASCNPHPADCVLSVLPRQPPLSLWPIRTPTLGPLGSGRPANTQSRNAEQRRRSL